MAKIRLTEGMRERLYAMAMKAAVYPKEQREFDRAYAKALPVMTKIVHGDYPASDMAICAKYGVTTKDTCIRLNLTPGGVDEFRFAEADAPVVVSRGYSCRNRIYACDEKATLVFNSWKTAAVALEEAQNQRAADYRALVNASKTLDEVEAIWPGAGEMRASLANNLQATLTADVIARIQADISAQRKAA
jgi:hypothetical protein